MTVSQINPVTPEEILAPFFEGVAENGVNRAIEAETALQALAYVVGRNFKAAEESADDGVFSLGIKLTFDRNEFPTSIKATARCSHISKTDIELVCPNEDG